MVAKFWICWESLALGVDRVGRRSYLVRENRPSWDGPEGVASLDRRTALHIQGERRREKTESEKGFLLRSVTSQAVDQRIALPSYLDTDEAKARYKGGTLVVTFAKRVRRGGRAIPIEIKGKRRWSNWREYLIRLKEKVRSFRSLPVQR